MIRESSTVKCESSANVSAAVHVLLGRIDPRLLKELAPPVIRPQTYHTACFGVFATQTVHKHKNKDIHRCSSSS